MAKLQSFSRPAPYQLYSSRSLLVQPGYSIVIRRLGLYSEKESHCVLSWRRIYPASLLRMRLWTRLVFGRGTCAWRPAELWWLIRSISSQVFSTKLPSPPRTVMSREDSHHGLMGMRESKSSICRRMSFFSASWRRGFFGVYFSLYSVEWYASFLEARQGRQAATVVYGMF